MSRKLCLLLSLSSVNATLRGHNESVDVPLTTSSSSSSSSSSGSSRRKLSSISAIQDSTLRSGSPYTNYGLDDDLSFIGNPTSLPIEQVESLLKFDLSTVGSWGKSHGEVNSRVYLQLFTGSNCDFSSSPHATQLGLLQVGLASNLMSVGNEVEDWEWNEESVTWFNSPLLKEDGAKMAKSLGLMTGKSWFEIEITSLIASIPATTLTLRISSILFAHLDDNLSLCTFASKNYRDGMFAPRVVLGSSSDYSSQGGSSSNTDEEPNTMNMLSSSTIGIHPQDEQDGRAPHKIFQQPKLHSKENLITQTATTEKVTKCAPPYSPSTVYAHNNVVSSQNNNYRCKGHPYTVWCSNNEYEPGVSSFWSLAWDFVNSCKTEIASIHSKDSDSDASFKEPTTFIEVPADSSTGLSPNSLSADSSAPLCPDKWHSTSPYTTGDRVTLPSTFIIWECKEQPFGYYCAHEAYEVGLEGGVYENAWKPVGKCVNGKVVEDQHYLDDKPHDETEEPATMSQTSSSSSNIVRPTAVVETQSSHVDTSDLLVLEQFENKIKCNLCKPGQIGINAEVPIDGGVAKCMDIYEYYLQNFLEGTKQCDAAQNWLNIICCGDESVMNIAESSTTTMVRATNSPSNKPITSIPTLRPITPAPTAEPIALVQDSHAQNTLASLYSQDEVSNLPECSTPYNSNDRSYTLNDRVSHTGGNYVCMMSTWCSDPDFEPRNGQYWMVVWKFEGLCKELDGFEEVNARPQRPTNFDTDTATFIDLRPVEIQEEEVSVSQNNDQPPSQPAEGNDIPPPPPVEPNHPTTPALVETVQEPNDTAGLTGINEPDCPPSWKMDHVYAEGDTVGVKGLIYTCKEFPYDGWCGQEGYEPANGAYWESAWEVGTGCVGGETREPTAAPVTSAPVTATPTGPPMPTTPPVSNVPDNDPSTVEKVYSILEEKKDALDNEIFLYQGSEPSTVYRYDGFVAGLKVMTESGVAGKFYYLGDDSENGYKYGLVNLAAFIGQSMKETIQYDACDENSWDMVDGKYPLSNACGQLGQKYQEYHCSEEEKHMECPVDPNMSIKAVTHAKWYGAPGPLFCGPKSEYEFTGFWDYGYGCNNPWADPPEYCEDYEGQKAGRYDNSEPVANVAGRTDVEGCCWWGRGVIQTTGICNFGKLNYFLGARAAEEGREARYPDVDFCRDPEAICASQEHQELKWIAGMFYWVESLQSYSERGWDYITELHKFVDGGMEDVSFINGVSGIVNRGCHDPPCGTGEVDGMQERAANFEKVIQSFLNR